MVLSLPSQRVKRALEQVIEWRGRPSAIRLDYGPEYIAQALVDWANDQRITLMYILLCQFNNARTQRLVLGSLSGLVP